MAEHRPVTARDAKHAVEGYAEMSDEAFARRFYADRAELAALGIAISSQRDEFTGEELYTLPREQYFLPPLHLTDEELAALQTCLYLLEGQFAYSEPLRLALQNLALGRPNPVQGAGSTSLTLNLERGYSHEIALRLAKLESAISRQRTIVFPYFAMSRLEESQRKIDPYGLYFRNSQWYLVGHDRDRDAIRTFRVSRIRGDIRFATRRERDFKLPPTFEIADYRDLAAWQLGEEIGDATLRVDASAAWLVERLVGRHGSFRYDADGSGRYITGYASLDELVNWVISMDGHVQPLADDAVVEAVATALQRARAAHAADPPPLAHPLRIVREAPEAAPPEPGPVAPERFAVLQALLADLLVRCGEAASAEVPLAELAASYRLTEEELAEQITLLNLVNFGGGCYAVYADVDEESRTVRVEKELYGDDFRRPARLSPLEAKAILMALDLVGTQVAAGAGTTLDSVRRKVEAARGRFDLRETPKPTAQRDQEGILTTLNACIIDRRLIEIEYLSRTNDTVATRVIEPYLVRGVGSDWYVEAYDRGADGERTFRVDRIRAATPLDDRFEPRADLTVTEPGHTPRGRMGTARIWYSPAVAARETELSATASDLADGSAVDEEVRFGSQRWLELELLRHRGEAVLLEPAELRAAVVRRADELAALLVGQAVSS